MDAFTEFLFSSYKNISTFNIILEITAVLFGFTSVYLAKKNHIGVYSTGMISTGIYIFILLNANLYGDTIINGYYFIMSIYGWYFWVQKKEGKTLNKISNTTLKEIKISFIIFSISCIGIFLIYYFSNYWQSWTVYVDIFTTGIFFVAMWLMAKRKIEHWVLWIIANIISIPLYLYKDLGITAFQYLIFTIIAIFGYKEWKKILKTNY